ncbi:MAG: hypothetical protein V2A61_02020 [Calditrichota bacterium]
MSELLASLSGFERVLLYIAIPFTLLTLIQMIMEIIGLSSHEVHHIDGDMTLGDVDHPSLAGYNFFTVRNFVYFLTMFGWVSLAVSRAGLSVGPSIIVGIIAGLLTTVLIAYIFLTLTRLNESGNIQLSNAVGKMASVYLRIPAERKGAGIIQLSVQGATIEINALTDGPELKTGDVVTVVQMLDPSVVLVKQAEKGMGYQE